MPAISIFVRPDEKSNRKQCGAGRDDHKNENQQAARDLPAALARVFCAAVSSKLSSNQARGSQQRTHSNLQCPQSRAEDFRGRPRTPPHRQPIPRRGDGARPDATRLAMLTLIGCFLNRETQIAPAPPFVMRSALRIAAASLFFVRVQFS